MGQDIQYTPKVWKIGDSLVITIPKHIAKLLNVKNGDTIQVSIKKLG